MKETYDVLVIGSGPGGYVAAIRAAQLGLKTAIVERENWGGVCLNAGCIPTKALLVNAQVAEIVSRRAGEFGLAFDNLDIDYGAAFRRARQVASRLAKGITFLLNQNGVELFRGTARLESPGRVRIEGGEKDPVTLPAKNIIIATGARPRAHPDLEIDGRKVITSTGAVLSPDLPESSVIIGGGPVGVEFASIWSAYGVEVTIIEKEDHILPGEEPEVSAVVERTYQKRGINIYAGSRSETIETSPDGVRLTVETMKGKRKVAAARALVAVGSSPNVEGSGLEKAGGELNDPGKGIAVDARMQTNIPGVYAVGDVTGKLMSAPAARAMGMTAAEAIAGNNPPPLNYRMIPRCVYSHPQVVSFGYGENAARAEGYRIKVGKFPFRVNGQALSLAEREGFVKITVEEGSNRILGASLVGPEVTELLPELTLAQMNNLTVEDVARNIHAHPTLSEAVAEAALHALGRAIHI